MQQWLSWGGFKSSRPDQGQQAGGIPPACCYALPPLCKGLFVLPSSLPYLFLAGCRDHVSVNASYVRVFIAVQAYSEQENTVYALDTDTIIDLYFAHYVGRVYVCDARHSSP